MDIDDFMNEIIKINQFSCVVDETMDAYGSDFHCLICSYIGHKLIKIISTLSDCELKVVFNIIERSLVDGDCYLKDCVSTCLLEALDADADKHNCWEKVKELLGPESLDYIREWRKFWGIKA